MHYRCRDMYSPIYNQARVFFLLIFGGVEQSCSPAQTPLLRVEIRTVVVVFLVERNGSLRITAVEDRLFFVLRYGSCKRLFHQIHTTVVWA